MKGQQDRTQKQQSPKRNCRKEPTMFLYLKMETCSGGKELLLRCPELDSREVTVDSGERPSPARLLKSMLTEPQGGRSSSASAVHGGTLPFHQQHMETQWLTSDTRSHRPHHSGDSSQLFYLCFFGLSNRSVSGFS